MVQPISRRIKRVPVPEHLVLDLILMRGIHYPKGVTVAMFDKVPADARVISVHHDHRSRVFYYTIEHESFDIVPDGVITPVVNGTFDLSISYVELPSKRTSFPDKNSVYIHESLDTVPGCLSNDRLRAINKHAIETFEKCIDSLIASTDDPTEEPIIR